jgi:hypothetical protein
VASISAALVAARWPRRGRAKPYSASAQPQAHSAEQAQCELVQAQQRHAGRLQPVDEDGLVETILAIQRGVAPVAAFEHLARGFAESAFVDIEQRRRAELEQREGQQRQH